MRRLPGMAVLTLLVVATTGCAADPTAETTAGEAADTATASDVDAVVPDRPADAEPSSTTRRDVAAERGDGGDSDPLVQTSTTPPTTSAERSGDDRQGADVPARYVPAAGVYRYHQTGYRETTGVNGGRESVSPSASDTITLSETDAATQITVTTEEAERDSTQEMVIEVTEHEARLVRLTSRSASTGLGYDVRPEPPAVLARLPYGDGDEWEIAWNDPASGVSGVGTGSVVTGQRVETPSGAYADTVMITVEQRLRGTVEGTLTLTSWIDPSTGVQVKQHVVTAVDDATGASRQDVTRVLQEFQP